MGGSGGHSDIGVHRGARALVDQGVIPKYLHGLDGAKAGSGGRNIRRHMHGKGERGIVVWCSDGDSPATGERGSKESRQNKLTYFIFRFGRRV